MIDYTDPIFLKVAGGAALYLLGGGRITRWAGIGLAAWGGWDYWQQRPKVLYQSVPMPKLPGLQGGSWAARATANLGRMS
jgi:hypothetical protein